MRLIDADELNDELIKHRKENDFNYEFENGIVRAMTFIDKSPTVDAVKVVRCKDCVHYGDDLYDCSSNSWPNWYCADGVKKDEANQGTTGKV